MDQFLGGQANVLTKNKHLGGFNALFKSEKLPQYYVSQREQV